MRRLACRHQRVPQPVGRLQRAAARHRIVVSSLHINGVFTPFDKPYGRHSRNLKERGE